MSIIVTGMEMPGSCFHCPFSILMDNFWCLFDSRSILDEDQRPEWCPLRPLPEKHGRLIEADSLKEQLEYYIREAGWDVKTNRTLGWVKDDFIDSEMTIVEAEG